MLILSTSVARYALGSASLLLLILIFVQILGGASFPILKFRTSEPQGYWAVVGAHCAALLMLSSYLRCGDDLGTAGRILIKARTDAVWE
jgi:hypothetical protein